MKKIILSLAVLGVLFTGCKKKDDEPTPSKSKTELLTANSWIATGATANKSVDYDGDGNSSLDVYSQYDACEKDDYFVFSNTNNIKSGTYNDNTITCDDTPASVAFTWNFNSTETLVSLMIGNTVVQEFTILELTDSTLKISFETEDDNGLAYIETDTYSKK